MSGASLFVGARCHIHRKLSEKVFAGRYLGVAKSGWLRKKKTTPNAIFDEIIWSRFLTFVATSLVDCHSLVRVPKCLAVILSEDCIGYNELHSYDSGFTENKIVTHQWRLPKPYLMRTLEYKYGGLIAVCICVGCLSSFAVMTNYVRVHLFCDLRF